MCGHSKGALVIDNAIRDLPQAMSEQLKVTTFGCPISDDNTGAAYMQFLGLLDGLGLLNSWGNHPEAWPITHHSTNTLIPLSMPVSLLARIALSEEVATAIKEGSKHLEIIGPSPATVPELMSVRERHAIEVYHRPESLPG